MDLLNQLREQLKSLWASWSTGQRIGISAASVGCVAVVLGTLYWATREDYVVLAKQLTPQRAAEIVGVLETEQIDAELNFSGSAVSVPRGDVNKATLALKDIWDPTSEDEGSLGGAFPGSPSEEEDRRRRHLEKRIASSIVQIRGIRSATVHVSMPDPSPFVADKVPTTASVVIDPTSPSAVTPSIAESVTSLVARAVEGLAPDQISLMDTSGRRYSVNDGVGSTMAGQFDYQHRVELRLASKAESMLAILLGPNKAVVRVSANIDFTETTRTNRIFDPDGKVKLQETIETVSQTGAIANGGEVGVASNVLPAAFDPAAEGASYKKEIISADFENATTEEVTRDIPGRITRLTVATIVDLTPAAPAAAAPTADGTEPPPAVAAIALDPAQIESIVRQAVGFDESRGDEIQVMTAALGSAEPLATIPGAMATWQEYQPMIQTIGTGLIAAGAFLMGFLMLKRMKPMVVTEGPADSQLSLDEVRHLASLSDDAKNNPEIAAKVLSAWLGVESNEEEAAPATESSAAPERQSRKAA